MTGSSPHSGLAPLVSIGRPERGERSPDVRVFFHDHLDVRLLELGLVVVDVPEAHAHLGVVDVVGLGRLAAVIGHLDGDVEAEPLLEVLVVEGLQRERERLVN